MPQLHTHYRYVARTKIFGGASENLGTGGVFSLGATSKKKGLQFGKPPFSASFVVISKKQNVCSSESHHFLRLLGIGSKIINATFLFSILKLKDLNVIFLRGKTIYLAGQCPSAPPDYMPAYTFITFLRPGGSNCAFCALSLATTC